MLTLPPLFLVFPPWHGWKNKNSSPLPLIHCSSTKSLGNVSLDRSSPTTTRVSTKYLSIIFLFSPLKAINQNLSMKFDRPPSSMRFDEWASKLNYVYFWSFFLFLIKRRINYTIDRFNVKVRARIKSSKLKYRFFLQKKSKSADRDRAASHEIARIHNLKQPVGYDKRTVLVRKGRNTFTVVAAAMSLKSVTNFPTQVGEAANIRSASLCSITSTQGVAFSLLAEASRGPKQV